MRYRDRVVSAFTVVLLGVTATAQCDPQWLPGEPYLSPRGAVRSSAIWDPDGAGPLPTVLAVAGGLDAATTDGAGVATFDGSQWTVLGDVGDHVSALAVHNGDLYAAATTTISFPPFTITQHDVKRWNGTAWQVVGTLASSSFVYSMASFNGRLVIGGFFTTVGGTAASNIAEWDGTTWSALGAGVQGTVRALAVFNGSLWVGGFLTAAGGLTAGNLARWNGSAWSVGPTFNGEVHALAVRNAIVIGQSYLFVGGAFTSLAGPAVAAQHIVRFEPQANTWTAVGGGVPGARCMSLLVRSVGLNSFEIGAGVEDTGTAQRFWRFASGAWTALGSLADGANNVWPATIAFYGGRYTVGLGPTGTATAVRAWDGSTWRAVTGRGIDGTVFAVAPAGNDLVVGGTFATISGATVNGVARGAPGAWTALGSGVQGGLGVFALATAANGDVLAAGNFTSAGGVPCANIARWNGVAWTPLGTGLDATAYALLVLPGGDVLVAGAFTTAGGVACNRIARWNGAVWSPLGFGLSAQVNALARLDNGDVVAGGNFTAAGGAAANRIARWNGTSWAPLGSGCNGSVLAVAATPSGDVYAAGTFTTAGGVTARIGRYSGGAWTGVLVLGITTQSVLTLAAHPSGDLFVGGEVFSFSLGPFGGWTSNLVRITGGSSFSSMDVAGSVVTASAITGDGDLVIGGSFETAEGVVSTNLARLDAPCPATAIPYGTGCSGLTAPVQLTPLAAPWLGGSWRLRASAFGPNAFALRCVGVTQINLPLASVLPALPGCTGWLLTDYAEAHLPVQGAVTIVTPVPLNPSLIGAQLNEQVLQFEPAPGGFIVSSSNAVQITVGTFF